MIATKEYMYELCNKFNITCFLAREARTEAFIQWYNDHKGKYAGDIELRRFDVESVMMYFNEDLESLFEGDGEK